MNTATPQTKIVRDEAVEAIKRRAKVIYSRGWSVREVRKHLLDEGHDVPMDTLVAWLYQS